MKAISVIIFLLAAFGVAGHYAYEDEQNQEVSYCENVHSGLWPDYDGIYDEVCKAKYGPAKKFKEIRNDRLTNEV